MDFSDPVAAENLIKSQDQINLQLNGLNCATCVVKLQNALQSVDQVEFVQINLAEQTALIKGKPNTEQLLNVIHQAGYSAEIIVDEQQYRQINKQYIQQEIKNRKWQGLVACFFGFLMMIWSILDNEMTVNQHNRLFWLVIGFFTLIIMLYSGRHFYQSAVKNLNKATLTMDTLVALSTGVAWLYSMLLCAFYTDFPEQSHHLYFESSLIILGLINFGKALEAKAKKRSSVALERLLNLTPPTAFVVDKHGEREIPLSAVQKSMILRLKVGNKVPVDGVIVQGNGWFDESMLTGEPLPLQKKQGDKINAGTIITDGTLLFRAEQVGNQTRLANIIHLVRQAQSSKPKIALLVDKIVAWFVPTVLVIASLSSVIWFYFTAQISYALVIFTTVLIIACPCALGLATPMSIIGGVARAAELGILVRDADAIQKATTANTLVFDKTGTITQGKPKVVALYCVDDNENDALRLAASLEQGLLIL